MMGETKRGLFKRLGLACVVGIAMAVISCADFVAAVNSVFDDGSSAGGTSASSGRSVASGAASAGQSGGADGTWQSPELSAALAPLYRSHVDFAAPTKPVAGLPADLDPMASLAIETLNVYRRQANLPPYRYDPALTAMAMKHVGFFLRNCGRAPMAHYEPANLPGYSAEGNEAAATSGLAFGVSSPMEAMSELMSGAYHRMQFLDPSDTRIGVGYGASTDGKCSIGLFVTRPSGTGGRVASAGTSPSFILFPPADAKGIPTEFMHGETPDPRPGVARLADGSAAVTGFPVTISMDYQSVNVFRSARVTMTDAAGKAVDLWVTDPAHPSSSRAPDIYGPGVSAGSSFQRNFDAVFIMPKKPLEKGTRYILDAKVDIGGQVHDLHWSFTTERSKLWKVTPDGQHPWERLTSVLGMAASDDMVALAPGKYVMTNIVRLSDLRIVGSGSAKTEIILRTSSKYAPMAIVGPVAMESLTIDSPKSIFYTTTGSTLLLRGVALRGGDGQTAAVSAEPSSTIVLEDLDASAFRTYFPIYSAAKSRTDLPTLYVYRTRLSFGASSLVYGQADIHRMPGLLKLP